MTRSWVQPGDRIFDYAEQSATDSVTNAPKRAIQKTAEVTGDLIGNNMPNRVTKFLKTSLQNNSETSEDDMYLQDKDRKLLTI